MCGNRLLVVRGSEHFYCPPWSSLVHDAYIQQQGPNGHSLLMVGLTNGLYVALLQEKSQLAIVDDFFVATRKSVERIFFLKDNEAAICYENANVETYQIVIEDYQKVELLPSGGGRSLKFFQAVASLWDTRRYCDSAYDTINNRLLVLSNTDLTVWAHATKGLFTPVCSVRVPSNAVAVLPGSQTCHFATLVFVDGGRQPVFIQETIPSQRGEVCTVMRLGSVRPLSQDIRLDSVQLACQGAEGTLLLYESHTCTLVLVTVASPIYEGIYDVVEVISTLQLGSVAVGMAYVRESKDSRAYFVVYGKSGILCRIGVQSLGQMVADMVKTRGSSDMVFSLLRNLDSRRMMEAVAGATFTGVSTEALSPLLNEVMQPSFCGNTMHVSPGVHGIAFIVRRELTLAQSFWGAPFSWHLWYDLERVSVRLQKWHKTLEGLLRPYGWLDCPKQANLSWKGFVATSHQQFTMRTALNAQAVLLETLLKGLRDADLLCWLYSLLLRGGPSRTAVSCSGLEPTVWGDDTDGVITTLCMEVLSAADRVVSDQLQARKSELPARACHIISIQTFVAMNQPDAALTYACANIRSFRHEQVLDYVAEKLENAFPDRMPHLRLLLCRLKHDRGAIKDLLEMLSRCTTNEPPERMKLRLGVVMQALVDDPVLQNAVVHWMTSQSLEDNCVIGFAEVLEEHSIVIKNPETLTAAFFICWTNRRRNPAVAARGFGDIARSKQRLALSSRILCIKLSLEYGPTTSEQLAYFVLLLQEEMADAIETWLRTDAAHIDLLRRQNSEIDVDELRHFYMEERRLFDLAGQYKEQGGAKVQLDLLKVHSETPESVTVEVLHDLLEFLLGEGMSATEAVGNIVREYYDGYAAGLPLLLFVEFLAQEGQEAEKIAALLQSSGVPPHAVFDTFLFLLESRREKALFSKGSVVTTLTSMVAQLSGEGRDLRAAYLIEHINGLLTGEHRAMSTPTATVLQESDVVQLQRAEALLRRSLSVSFPP